MNSVLLIGRLTRDPELRATSLGVSNTIFSLAVDGKTNADGEKKTDFINIIAWKNIAENISKYCKKGSQIAIQGRISTRSYEASDGTKKYITEVIADNVKFLDKKEENKESENNNTVTSVRQDEIVLTDDDLPF